MRKEIKLYNMIFPVWALYALPFAWIAVLPANFIIDSLVVLAALALMKTGNIKDIYKRIIFKVWGVGFAADILGVISLMILFGFADDITQNKYRGLAYNTHDQPLGLALISAGVIISGALIYIFNYYGHFRALDMEQKKKKKLALALAILTAPYLMYIPAEWLNY